MHESRKKSRDFFLPLLYPERFKRGSRDDSGNEIEI